MTLFRILMINFFCNHDSCVVQMIGLEPWNFCYFTSDMIDPV